MNPINYFQERNPGVAWEMDSVRIFLYPLYKI